MQRNPCLRQRRLRTGEPDISPELSRAESRSDTHLPHGNVAAGGSGAGRGMQKEQGDRFAVHGCQNDKGNRRGNAGRRADKKTPGKVPGGNDRKNYCGVAFFGSVFLLRRWSFLIRFSASALVATAGVEPRSGLRAVSRKVNTVIRPITPAAIR